MSNHGGRQLDGAMASLRALPAVRQAAGGHVPVLLDGGVRRGGDIAKALAPRASTVLFGRPLLYCLAADGERGAAALLSLLADELHRVMALLGAPTLASLRGAGVQTVSTVRGWSTTAMQDA
ncbi:alpha-hydroxy-acid oxidizing protein [Rhizobacter sp. AJA081-3]|uniref:alpha-hydroxy-acid oxidizing protein n=1 Tax=Rhizobacter sp. AJA081-3 TaxID=2753607 RepID=UPI001FD77A8D|nr:alpha-hydroxy-acid oxidizing protein [Rhizobacter sp. AJA081-3]